MDRVAPTEIAVEAAGAAWLGGCVGYAAWLAAPILGASPLLFALGGVAAGVLVAAQSLKLSRRSGFSVPGFDLASIDPAGVGKLLLTDEVLLLTDEVRPAPAPVQELVLTLEQRLGARSEPDELLLDDVLAELGPESRVIRLFDPAAMPTAGELQSRIDRHLHNSRQAPAYPDAAQALNDALADLRRSLR